MPKIKLTLLVIGLILIHIVDSSNVHYIIPSSITQCPAEESCLSISTLVANSSNYFGSNTTIVFLEGSHILDSELVVSNIDGSLTLSTNGSGTAAISCNDSGSLEFSNISQLQISGLEFIKCSSKVELVDQFTLEDSRFYGGNDNSALDLTNTNTLIVRSSFVSNTAGTYQSLSGVLEFLRDNRNDFPYYGRPTILSNSTRVGGAVIVTSSTVSVSGSHFESNTAEVGGAIFSELGSNINISNCTFVNNSATGCSDNSCHGGALFIDSGCTVIAHNSIFMNNTASFGGGAIALFQGTFSDATLNVFSRNRAGRLGGALSAYNRSRITIDNSYCSNNSGRCGRVMYASSSSSITVGNSSFDNNEAGSRGGVMYASSSSSIAVGNSSFDNNEARYYGGVMYASSSSSIAVGNSSFDNNEAGSRGGVMYASFSNSITVGNSSFDNNTAGNHGGVMYASSNSSIAVGNSSFDNNEAGLNGGVMYASSSSSITVGNSSFDNNTAGNHGGVMYTSSRSSITVGNSSFDNNEAGLNGGVVCAYISIDNYYTYFSITVHNSSFENNKAGNDGGVMYAHFDDLSFLLYYRYFRYTHIIISITVGNSSFENNKADYDGGVVYAYSSFTTVSFSSSITVGNSSFENNKAYHDGGVMYAYSGISTSITTAYSSSSASITVGNSSFENNKAYHDGGVMYAYSGISTSITTAYSSSSITVGNSSFENNKAYHDGGVVYAYSSGIIYSRTITNNVDRFFQKSCTFFYNSANEGGVVYVHNTNLKDSGSMYYGNMAGNGGVITLNEGSLEVIASKFMNNTARNSGGVLYTPLYNYAHVIKLKTSYFVNNSAISGGAIATLLNATITVIESSFTHNKAIRGGALYILIGNNLTANYSNFSHNLAKHDGGMIYSENQNRLIFKYCELNFNRADNNGGVVCLLSQSELNISEDNSFIGNQARSGGVAYTSESTTNINSQNLLIANNTAIEIGGAVYSTAAVITFFSGDNRLVQNQAHAGGALYLSKANLSVISGNNTFVRNEAIFGGAIHLNEGQLIFSGGNNMLIKNIADDGGAIYVGAKSKIIVETDNQTTISANSAVHHGGGLYLTMSELKIRGESLYITRNRANKNGGGIHSTNSTIIVEGVICFVNNEAENGGGVSLERNAKLHGGNGQINLVTNMASHYGGAIYVDDETNPDMCAAVNVESTTPSTESECFSKSVLFDMSDNSAGVSGSNLFGGLLDRCTVHNESQMGIMNFHNSSNINMSQVDTISSHPIRLCFCRDGKPDCYYQPEPIQVNRGKVFSVELIAYDQVHQAVNANIQCFLNSSAGRLGEGQQIQAVNKACTELKYNLFTPNDYEGLTFSAVRGPCNNILGISERSVMIEIICSCPIGFQRSIINNNETSCDCVCHQVLQSYEKTKCNPLTESIIRRENFWISLYIWSNSSGYVIYPHCPLDYCYTPDKQVSVNLNHPNGSDAQCDLNRMGTLCGTCKPGLSVSLGSSNCVHCPHYWPALLVTIAIVFILSGIGLVALVLALNLTVAIGTLNAIILYANLVAANKSALFPSGVSFASVFISWLNFDLGFDICFFDGMDTYIKIWLQLAFPAYIIILVVVIIQLSYYFDAFGRLVGKKDPVATLATLILLCYAKLLQTIIAAFSSATLVYPDGSKKTLWLPDATIEYFTSKHAVLFFIAILILLAGLVYTLLLFSWQWFLYCPRKRVKWIRNQKLSSFMEIYLTPYTPRHRYWTGLLLLVRVSVYLVSAFNPSSDPRVILLTTNFITSSIFLYIAIFGVRMYKNRFINAMETLTYFNIMALSIFTWYTIDADTKQTAVTNISVGITFIQLIAVIIYHVCKHTNQKLFAMIQGSAISIKVKEKLIRKKQKSVNHKPVPADEDIHQFYELLDMIDSPANTNDYNIKPKSAGPTQSVVERPKSQLAPATPPSPKAIKEAIKEEPKLESEEQSSKQDGIDLKSTPIKKNKKCVNKYSGTETADSEYDNTSTNPETEMEYDVIMKENSISKPHPSPQINNYNIADIEQAQEEAMESDNSEQEGVDSHYIIVEAEVNDY